MAEADVFAGQLRRVADGQSVRSLAARSGWSRSTVHEWLTGVRIPNQHQLDDLLDALHAPPTTRGRVQNLRAESVNGQRRGAAEDRTSPDSAAERPPDTAAASTAVLTGADRTATPDGVDSSTAGPTRGRRGLLIGASALLGSVLIACGAFVVGRWTAPDAAVTGAPLFATARVANTHGTGAYTYRGPSTRTHPVESLWEGQGVVVVCEVRNGAMVVDKKLGVHRAVWALLESGAWIPDLYLDTPKIWPSPDQPPAPIKTC